MAEFPAPADPAIGVPTKPWADAEADIPTITVSARASLLEALNMKNSFFFGVHEMFQAKSRAGCGRYAAFKPIESALSKMWRVHVHCGGLALQSKGFKSRGNRQKDLFDDVPSFHLGSYRRPPDACAYRKVDRLPVQVHYLGGPKSRV